MTALLLACWLMPAVLIAWLVHVMSDTQHRLVDPRSAASREAWRIGLTWPVMLVWMACGVVLDSVHGDGK